MKKKTIRNQNKFSALDKTYNPKIRKEELDYDYVDNLPNEKIPHCSNFKGNCKVCNDPKTRFINPKEYLSVFTEEFTNSDFRHKKRVHKTTKKEYKLNRRLKSYQKTISNKVSNLIDLIKDLELTPKKRKTFLKFLEEFKTKLETKITKHLSSNKYILDSYNRTNSRNRCVLSKAKAHGKAVSFEMLPTSLCLNQNIEDDLISRIDGEDESDLS